MRTLAILFLLIPVTMWGHSSVVSSVPLPKTYVLNLDPYACDTQCLTNLIAHEQVFSFLAQMPDVTEDQALNEQRLIYVSLFNLDSGEQGEGVRVALLLPERVIGRYAVSTTNSVMAYLLSKNRHFQLKTFKIGDESPEAIRAGLQRITDEHFYYVIAPLTKKGAVAVARMHPQPNIFFPTVNIRDVNTTAERLYYGGIDYRAQIELLMREAKAPLVIFYDKSDLGNQLKKTAEMAFLLHHSETDPETFLKLEKQIYAFPIGKHTTNLKSILYKNDKIKQGTFFLNTPLIKSGMIMSQLTLYDVNASRILSTQINYDAMLFDITQRRDREHMLIANSIGPQNGVLVESNKLLQNDILFDWINYATTLGIDYFYHLCAHTPREYSVPFKSRQIDYPVSLLRPVRSRFEPYTPKDGSAPSPFEE